MNKLTILPNWEKMKNAVSVCTSIDEVKKIKDQMEALRSYAKQAKEGLEVQNNIADIKLRAERKIGKLSKELPKKQGDRTDLTLSHDGKKLNLKKLGISHHERYEAIASLPEKKFEQHIQEIKESNKELTTVGIIKMAKELSKQDTKEKNQQEYAAKAKHFKEQDIKIIHGDFRKQNIENNSIDLILTDPPYPQEFLYLWQDLFNIAEKVLKPSGFLVAYSGQMHLDKIFKMKNNLIYYWTMCLDFPDGSPHPLINGRNIINEWKPILIFQKPPFKKKDVIADKITSNYTGQELHDNNWGQTLEPFEFLVEKFSKPNDLIYEPFAGSGTTLLACKNKKRKCIGVEIEKKYINIIKGRL